MAPRKSKGLMGVSKLQQDLPGPKRLVREPAADNSGEVHADPKFIADRQAIINHVTAYSYLIDEGRWEDWFKLFAKDAVVEVSTPELGTIICKGKGFRGVIENRYIIPSIGSTAQRRHTMGNVHVAEQTPTKAKVRLYMFISTMPNADKLNMLTSGTYNATLEKRKGKWQITRWYIECDAPLNPSALPEGVSPDELRFIPDPRLSDGTRKYDKTESGLPIGVSGKVTGKKLGTSMGDLYPAMGIKTPWVWKNIDVALIDYLTPEEAAAEILPADAHLFAIPDLPGQADIKLVFAKYRGGTLEPYNEVVVGIPCLYHGQLSIYVAFIYVTTDDAMASGRELGGYPKKIADIRLEHLGNQIVGRMTRGGLEVASISFTKGGRLFSLPLPPGKKPKLAYPYNLTLPLPEPTGKPQPYILPFLSMRVIPNTDAEKAPYAVSELNLALWELTRGPIYSGSNPSVDLRPSGKDPLYKLPVSSVISAVYVQDGEMQLGKFYPAQHIASH